MGADDGAVAWTLFVCVAAIGFGGQNGVFCFEGFSINIFPVASSSYGHSLELVSLFFATGSNSVSEPPLSATSKRCIFNV